MSTTLKHIEKLYYKKLLAVVKKRFKKNFQFHLANSKDVIGHVHILNI